MIGVGAAGLDTRRPTDPNPFYERHEMIKTLSDLAHATAPQREQEAADVRALGERIGYGRMMQLAEQEWNRSAISIGTPGGELTVGPCAGMLVPCVCDREIVRDEHCEWCCGTKRVTERVRRAILRSDP